MVYFGDFRSQADMLKKQIDQHNAPIIGKHLAAGGSTMEFIPGVIDFIPALMKLKNRVSRFYGLNNKYDGRGNRR